MTLSTRTSINARNVKLDALRARCNNGYIRVYSSAQEATPETAPSGTLLTELRFGATAFPAASGGVLTANTITDDADADATGTAQSFRAYESDGTTPVFDGTAGVGSGFNLNLPTTAIAQHNVISVSSLIYTEPMQGA